MEIKISPVQIQKQTLSPLMQQSIKILLLPVIELHCVIEQELENNPLLEIDEEKTALEKDAFDDILNLNIKQLDDIRNISMPNENQNQTYEGKEKQISQATPLEDYLLQQLRLELTDPQEITIGELIIGNLNEAGYFTSSCDEIAQLLGIDNTDTIKDVLQTIQNFEPLGIASRDLKECLLIQAHYKFNGDNDLIKKIITNYLEKLGHKKYVEIAKKLKISTNKVEKLAEKISSLEPMPARRYRPIEGNIFIQPDVTIIQNDADNYDVNINNKNIPVLRINTVYQSMLRQPNRTKEEIEFIREKNKNALFFIKSIEQRNQTLKNISEYILNHQKDFLEQGTTAIKPMILKNVAEAIGRNESTISRAISNKYIDTPQGMYPIKFFFSSAVLKNSTNNADSISARGIKEEIKLIIDEENKLKPLSDQDIQSYFKGKQLPIARRTISKYRQSLKILPSYLRKK